MSVCLGRNHSNLGRIFYICTYIRTSKAFSIRRPIFEMGQLSLKLFAQVSIRKSERMEEDI